MANEPRLYPTDLRTYKDPSQIGEDVLTEKAVDEVKVIVEGTVGTGKTAILIMLYKLLKEKGVDVKIEDQYTLDMMNMDMGTEDQMLKMYNPTIVLQEKLLPAPAAPLVPPSVTFKV